MRVMGASRRKLSQLVLMEGIGLSLSGSLTGVLLGLVIMMGFSGFIEQQLGLPFLLPGAGTIALTAAGSILLSTMAGALAAGYAACRIAQMDTGLILRSGD